MRKYEIMYILKTALKEDACKEAKAQIANIITSNGGVVNKTDDSIGTIDLAYPINDEKKGTYVVLQVLMGNKAINEFNRLVRINPNVLRYLITNKD